jgi:hypothetical protein
MVSIYEHCNCRYCSGSNDASYLNDEIRYYLVDISTTTGHTKEQLERFDELFVWSHEYGMGGCPGMKENQVDLYRWIRTTLEPWELKDSLSFITRSTIARYPPEHIGISGQALSKRKWMVL